MVAAAALPGGAQQVPLKDLPKPSKEIDDPFTLVSGAIEFRGGKVIAVDAGEAQLTVVDFAAGTKTALGRQGGGPGEYKMPAGLFRLQGDTLWLLDAVQQRIVAFRPDLTPGTVFPFLTVDAQTRSTLAAPFANDRRGRLYASAMSLDFANIGRSGGTATIQLPDSVSIVRIDDPRALAKAVTDTSKKAGSDSSRKQPSRTEISKIRYPISGKPEMKVDPSGSNIKLTSAFPGLVAGDAWAVFPDGRMAIVHNGLYTIEFITPDGRRSTPARIEYEHIKVTDADKKAEMDEARQQGEEQMKAAKKMMPANMNLSFELTPPASWPAEYPPVSPLGALAAPDGRLWVKRAIPTRVGREQWDVIDASGKLVARWQLPAKVNLIAVGTGAVYTVRKDEDDLRYLQKIEIPK